MQIEEFKTKEIICSTCHIKFDQIVNYKLHLGTEFHVYNTKRRMAELAPITEDVFDKKKSEMVSANASAITDVIYKCNPCNKSFKSTEKLDEHKLSKKHKKNEKEFCAKNPNFEQNSIFKSITQNSETHSDHPSIKNEGKRTITNILDDLKNEFLSEQKQKKEQEQKQVQESSSFIIDEQSCSSHTQKRKKTSLENPRVCLFCNKQCSGVKKCIDHMRIEHSFILLDIDCLVDLKGILNYMAERIHIGQLCLYCSKQFKDPVRCQQHMIDKQHCMMNIEDEDEYVDFYDFSKAYENHPLLIKDNKTKQLENVKEKAADDEDSWEECDEDDLSSDDEKTVDENEVEIKMKEEKLDQSSQSFSIIKSQKEFEDFGIQSFSSVNKSKVTTGKTRQQVFSELNIKKAEILPSGEVRLGNGKIMGTREWHYLYKQKPRMPEDRQSILINKIALEYRKLKAIANGGEDLPLAKGWLDKKGFQDKQFEEQMHLKRKLKYGLHFNGLQHHFKDPTGHLQ